MVEERKTVVIQRRENSEFYGRLWQLIRTSKFEDALILYKATIDKAPESLNDASFKLVFQEMTKRNMLADAAELVEYDRPRVYATLNVEAPLKGSIELYSHLVRALLYGEQEELATTYVARLRVIASRLMLPSEASNTNGGTETNAATPRDLQEFVKQRFGAALNEHIAYLARHNRLDEADSRVDLLTRTFKLPLTDTGLQAVLYAHALVGNDQKVEYYQGLMRELNIKPSSRLYGIELLHALRTQGLEGALKVLNTMKQLSIKPTIVIINNLISYCFRHGLSDYVEHLWKVIPMYDLLPNRHTYSISISGYINHDRNNWYIARKLFHEMITKGFYETTKVVNSIISSAMQDGCVEEAQHIFETMKAQSALAQRELVQYQNHLRSTAMKVAAQNAEMRNFTTALLKDGAHQLISEPLARIDPAIDEAFEIKVSTLKTPIATILQTNRLTSTSVDPLLPPEPDEFTYQNMVRGFLQNNYPDAAIRVFEEFMAKPNVPGTSIQQMYVLLVKGLEKCGARDQALEWERRSKEAGFAVRLKSSTKRKQSKRRWDEPVRQDSMTLNVS